MNEKFLKVNIDAVKFAGLSLSAQRKLALFNTALIWIVTAIVLYYFISLLDERENYISFTILVCISVMVLDYIITNRFLPYSLAKLLVEFTPIASLYRQDMTVLNSSRAELLKLANQVRFEDYLVYSRINPDIRSEESLNVMIQQRKGDLSGWIKKPQHLKMIANLVYQIYLVELFIQQDSDRF